MADLPPNPMMDDLLAALPLPALLVDRTERVIFANRDAQVLAGRDLVGRHFATILRQPPVIESIESCLRTHRPATARHLSNDGVQDTAYDVACRFVPRVGDGGAGAVLVCFRDITEMETAGQMRRDFVANVSHELRTPLTAMMGFIETLLGPARNDEKARERFLGIMADEASRMNRLVGDLLSLNRVESEERVRPTERVNLTELIKSSLVTFDPMARATGTRMSFEGPQDPVHVTGDCDQLRQVLANLLENAIKYGRKQGLVQIGLTSSARDPALRGPGARVQIRDDGPGIDPVHLPRLTERFYRADNHRSREMGGTGLGLAIVKHIVGRHRGRLRIESEPGQGATFTVILPTDIASDQSGSGESSLV